MSQPSHAKFGVQQLYQTCVVVYDLDKSMEHYRNILGIGRWEVYDYDDSIISDMTYHGRPARQRFRAALTMVGPMQLELIQPVEGDSTYGDFLKEHGEGLHHLGFVLVDNLGEAIKTWEKEGCPCVQSGRLVSGQLAGFGYAYVDATKSLGIIIELVETPEGKPIPGRS